MGDYSETRPDFLKFFKEPRLTAFTGDMTRRIDLETIEVDMRIWEWDRDVFENIEHEVDKYYGNKGKLPERLILGVKVFEALFRCSYGFSGNATPIERFRTIPITVTKSEEYLIEVVGDNLSTYLDSLK